MLLDIRLVLEIELKRHSRFLCVYVCLMIVFIQRIYLIDDIFVSLYLRLNYE